MAGNTVVDGGLLSLKCVYEADWSRCEQSSGDGSLAHSAISRNLWAFLVDISICSRLPTDEDIFLRYWTTEVQKAHNPVLYLNLMSIRGRPRNPCYWEVIVCRQVENCINFYSWTSFWTSTCKYKAFSGGKLHRTWIHHMCIARLKKSKIFAMVPGFMGTREATWSSDSVLPPRLTLPLACKTLSKYGLFKPFWCIDWERGRPPRPLGKKRFLAVKQNGFVGYRYDDGSFKKHQVRTWDNCLIIAP